MTWYDMIWYDMIWYRIIRIWFFLALWIIPLQRNFTIVAHYFSTLFHHWLISLLSPLGMRLSSAPQHFDLRAWKNKKRRMSCWISRWGTRDFHLYPAPWLTSDHDSCTDRGHPKLQSYRLSLLADPEASNNLS